MENTNLSKQQQVSEIMRQMLTQAQTAGQYFTNDQIKEMTRKVSAEVELVHQQTQNPRYGASHIGATAKDVFFFSSRSRHTMFDCDWSSDVCSSDLASRVQGAAEGEVGVGASGGDIDLAFGSALNSAGTYTVYVASLNGGSVSVAHSSDNGATYTNVPVQGGLPGDDREWIAAYGADTSLLTFHDVATNDIDVLRSTNGGSTYTQVSEAIPETDYKAGNNELGNIVIDHRNASPVAGGFWAYQSFVAPSSDPGLLGSAAFNEAFVAVSNDGGSTWSDQPVPCSTSNTDLDHNFPNVSVDPAGNIWTAWSDDTNVYTAVSRDHGATWTCSPKVSTNTAQAIFPWLVATSNGVDLVYYGAPTTGKSQTWSVYFAQDPTGSATGWATPSPVVTVHSGSG